MTLDDLPRPEPGDRDALLTVQAVGICGSDVHGFTGESGRRTPGMVMGHEVVGQVSVLGSDVTGLNVGDHVAIFNVIGCGQCMYCRTEQPQRCAQRRVLGVNAGRWGAMAEFLAFPADGLFVINPTVDPTLGLLAEPLGVATHAVRRADAQAGQSAAVVGAGMIGNALVIALNCSGVDPVFAVDIIPERLELARAYGAVPIQANESDPEAIIRDALGGEGTDLAFEAVGSAQTVRAAFELLRIGGTLTLVGNLAKEFTLPLQGVTDRETTIRGSYGFTKQDFADAVALINDNELGLEPLISDTCSLEQTPMVMTELAKGTRSALKVVIRPQM